MTAKERLEWMVGRGVPEIILTADEARDLLDYIASLALTVRLLQEERDRQRELISEHHALGVLDAVHAGERCPVCAAAEEASVQ